ncbi:hypothetical protein [Dokdonella fugitiva]|jgi:hypothetical protein|uniref:hypothetical protein n=1 Tax=Dokdonella fugitiva TaxID=328517 RepID=UPI0015FE1579|nr:hypothetical protein [Dokdonella fugitiva]MBA8884418.1 hypothetical protein [Dokdonella fugitiva]
MNNKDLIEFDVALLLLRYGEHAILRQLSEALRQTPEQLEEKVASIRNRKAKNSRPKPVAFTVSRLAKDLETFDQLVSLEEKFDNRTFLKELKDVKRFLERNGNSLPRLKSRQDAKKHLFEVLAGKTSSELIRLQEDEVVSGGQSSLGVISDHILGRSGGR